MNLPSMKSLWNALTDDERKEACEAVWTVERMPRQMLSSLLLDLANLMRFRPQYLGKQPPEVAGKWLLSRVNHPDLRSHISSLVMAWLAGPRKKALESFLDAMGIPQQDGFITGEVPPPTAETFAKGLRLVRQEHGDRVAAIYMGFLIAERTDGFWAALPSGLAAEGFDPASILAPSTPAPPAESPPPAAAQEDPVPEAAPAEAAPDNSSEPPEMGEQDTILDALLFKAVVASALGAEGAFSRDQVEHLVEEVVDLSADRSRSHMHRGFLHAVFASPPLFDFRGVNDARKAWYALGFFLGRIRMGRTAECLEILKTHPGIDSLLTESMATPCGARIFPLLYATMIQTKAFDLLRRWLRRPLYTMPARLREQLLGTVQRDAANMLRQGQVSEADFLLNVVLAAVCKEDLDPDFAQDLKSRNMRKRAQVLQYQSNFADAGRLLEQLLAQENLPDRASVLADLGLVQAGFRTLVSTLPPAREDAAVTHREALSKGRAEFEEAVKIIPRGAAKARFCLGMLELLSGLDHSPAAAEHFQKALTGMLRWQEAYEKGGVIHWARFGLGLALLESMESANLKAGMERLGEAMASKIPIPGWLWVRALEAASVLDDRDPVRKMARHLLSVLGPASFPLLQRARAHGLQEVRRAFFDWQKDRPMPALDRWSALEGLFAPGEGDDPLLGEDILDAMETLAATDHEVRKRFAAFLAAPRRLYEPAWSSADADDCLARLYEMDGRFAEAAVILGNRFFEYRAQGGSYAIGEAQRIAERISGFGVQPDVGIGLLQSLAGLNVEEPEPASAHDRLAACQSVRILYVGGNETQAAYEEKIKKTLGEAYPELKADFYLPGWDSSWNIHLEKVRPMIQRADAVVLSPLVRTQFGRHVRRICDSAHPWFSCTGRGYDSLKNSIEKAALWAVQRKAG